MHSATRFAALGFAAALAGCALFGSAQDRELRNDPSFKEGYEDGCAAANAQGADLRDRTVRDKTLYDNDEKYRAGWSNGYQTCRPSYAQPGQAPGDSPIRDPVPGQH
jgi:hypothetical protein